MSHLKPCCPPIGIARVELSLSPCILLFVVVVEGCGGGEVVPVNVMSQAFVENLPVVGYCGGGVMMWHMSMRQNRCIDMAYLRPYVKY